MSPDTEAPVPAEMADALKPIVEGLSKEVAKRLRERRVVETRWLEDLRQFHGQYDDETAKRLETSELSALFINETGPKTKAFAAKLGDMLFPTDDKNWDIKPTPNPTLASQTREAALAAEGLVREANRALESQGMEAALDSAAMAQTAGDVASAGTEALEEAKKRSDKMRTTIEDQLVECRYQAEMRKLIRDGAKLGTGVCKGPVLVNSAVQRWRAEAEASGFALATVSEGKPAIKHVDPWNFFPPMDATTIEECESFFERHPLTKAELRKLARQPGFSADAIRRLLSEEPPRGGADSSYLSELRAVTGENTAVTDTARYHVWEYRGPLSAEDMETVSHALDKADMLEDVDADDPLQEIQVCIWFCGAEILFFGPHHLDSGEPIYSVFNVDEDDASIFGFGIPYLMRHSQKAMNSAWRMMMDNAGVSSGPQIVVDQSAIEPSDGDWKMKPRKVWLRKPNTTSSVPFQTFDIPTRQSELAAIIEMSGKFIETETSMPDLAQGEQGSHVTKTMGGMSILMNSVNVVFRAVVKNFDDAVTTPNIRRQYHWNMQFSDDDEIKGDFEVDARGSSVLLVREIQAQNLMLLLQLADHPVWGAMLRPNALFKKLLQSMHIDPKDVLKDEEEVKREAEAMAAQAETEGGADQASPDAMRLEVARLEQETKLEIAQMERDTAMLKLATSQNIELERLKTILAREEASNASKERVFAAETALKERHGSGI